jgi:hypothetical protein
MAAFDYLFNELGTHAQRGYVDSSLQRRVDVLREWVGVPADGEVSAAMERA